MLLDTLDRLDDQATSQQEGIVRTASVLSVSNYNVCKQSTQHK
jgi:hypothetical protein